MKRLLLLSGLLSISFLDAQTVPNGGFEFWNTSSYENPQFYPLTSNNDIVYTTLSPNTTKVTDPQQGTYAVRMETIANANDTMFGYFVNGDPNTGMGGIPYTQHPITLTGYYKCNVMPNDTAIVVVMFKEAGSVISADFAIFTGNVSTYTPFTVTLTIPALANPDTVIFGAASSNAFVTNGIPGSMLQLDNLSFTGVTSQPTMMNGSFENWVPVNRHTPAQWGVGGDTLNRTTDAHSGTYALQLNTVQYGPANAGPSFATNGIAPPGWGPQGGRPYVLLNDTLYGWYKYTPNGIDSAGLVVSTTMNGTQVGGGVLPLPPAANYTFFSLPFASFSQPDTLILAFVSSWDNTTTANAGSVLKVDDVYLASSPLSAPEVQWNVFGFVKLFPNPATDVCWLEWTSRGDSPVTLTLSDATGRTISEETFTSPGAQRHRIDTTTLESGVYLVTLMQEGKRVTRKLIVE